MLVFALFVVLPDMGDLTSDCGRTVLDECFLTNITSEETGPTVNCSTLQVSQRNSLQRNTTNEMVKREPIRGTLFSFDLRESKQLYFDLYDCFGKLTSNVLLYYCSITTRQMIYRQYMYCRVTPIAFYAIPQQVLYSHNTHQI